MRRINKLMMSGVVFCALVIFGISGISAQGISLKRNARENAYKTWSVDGDIEMQIRDAKDRGKLINGIRKLEVRCKKNGGHPASRSVELKNGKSSIFLLSDVCWRFEIVLDKDGRIRLKKGAGQNGYSVNGKGLKVNIVIDPTTGKPLVGKQRMEYSCGTSKSGEAEVNFGTGGRNDISILGGAGCDFIEERGTESLRGSLEYLSDTSWGTHSPKLGSEHVENSDFIGFVNEPERGKKGDDKSSGNNDADGNANSTGSAETDNNKKTPRSSSVSSDSSVAKNKTSGTLTTTDRADGVAKNASDSTAVRADAKASNEKSHVKVVEVRLKQADRGENTYSSLKKNGRYNLLLNRVVNPSTGKPLDGSHTVLYVCTNLDADKAAKSKAALFSNGSSSFESDCLFTKPTEVVAILK